MDELLHYLEKKIKTLIDQYDELKSAHQQLSQSKVAVSHEREVLLRKQKKAIHQIETMITKLKSIEK